MESHFKSIAIWSLWAIQSEISNKPQQFGNQSCPTHHEWLELWDQIHIRNPTLAIIYLDVLLGCITVKNNQVTEGPKMGQAMRAASLCLLRALPGVDPTSEVVNDIHKKYIGFFPPYANFNGLSSYYLISAIHALFIGRQNRYFFGWMDYKPCPQEHAFFANTLVQVAHKARDCWGKVPRWTLCFALHSLAFDPPPSTLLIVDCLSIIAIDMGCDILSPGTVTPDERYVYA